MNQSKKKITDGSRLHRRPASSSSPFQQDPQNLPNPVEETSGGSSEGFFLEVGSDAEDGTPTPEPLETPDELNGPEPASDGAEADMDTAISNEPPYLSPHIIQLWQQPVEWNALSQSVEDLQEQWSMHEHSRGYPHSPGLTYSSAGTPFLTEDDDDHSSHGASQSDMSFEEGSDTSPPSSNSPVPSMIGTHSSVTSDIQSSLDGQLVSSLTNSSYSSSGFPPSFWTRSPSSLSPVVHSLHVPEGGRYSSSSSQSPSVSSPSPMAVDRLLSIAGTRLIPYAMESSSGRLYAWAGPRSPTLSTASPWLSPGRSARSLTPSPFSSSSAMDLDRTGDTAVHRERPGGDRDERTLEESLSTAVEASSSSSPWPMQARVGTSVDVRVPALAVYCPSHRRCSTSSNSGRRYFHECSCDDYGEDFVRRAVLIRHTESRFRRNDEEVKDENEKE